MYFLYCKHLYSTKSYKFYGKDLVEKPQPTISVIRHYLQILTIGSFTDLLIHSFI